MIKSTPVQNPYDLEIHLSGQDFEKRGVPTIFYFSLSAKESLEEPPFNSPVPYWLDKGIRVCSFTLPFHGEGFDRKIGVDLWGKDFEDGNHALVTFFERLEAFTKELFKKGVLKKNKVGAAGLSRGAFVAAHLVARCPDITYLLGYAPMTRLSSQPGFVKIKEHPLIENLSLYHLCENLEKTHVRFYMGNNDTRVGTEHCFHFIHTLAQSNYKKGDRSPKVEMIIHPSAGHMGHGTLPDVFEAGAKWMASKFGIQETTKEC